LKKPQNSSDSKVRIARFIGVINGDETYDPTPPFDPFEDTPTPPRKRRRRFSLARAIKQAATAGMPVKAATLGAEGVTLEFGEPEPTAESNPWLADLNKATKE
jgi:hypothetical protein